MNKICKQYITDVKSFFPIIGKEERKYIKKFTNEVENFCEEEDVTSKEVLYQNFGIPNSIANMYYTSMDIDFLIKRIRITKYVKRTVFALLFTALVIATACCTIHAIKTYQSFKEFEDDKVSIQEITIE